MQSDDVIWGVINRHFCSFKAKLSANESAMCRNEYNVTGLCNRGSCPLANSRYATVREHEGHIYLYMKTIERAHTPAKLWERVKLSKNFLTAIEQINEHLMYWDDHLINKVKLRLTKIRQYLIRTRKLRKQVRKKLIPIKKKTERREVTRERKAEIAAEVEKKIKLELLDRLKRGVYDQVNLDERTFQKLLDEEAEEEVSDEDERDIEDGDEEEEDEEPITNEIETVDEFVEDLDDLEDYGDFDVESASDEEEAHKRKGTGKQSKNAKRRHLEIEDETQPAAQEMLTNW
eukprot:TRINITY_DN1200_c0_g1_i1.p1 TRINITY_DN1200_c0_g1~~TRINITY_DN1200_c0_g1_i1.p1  ORF type:complete len:289 (+),score=92.36 TRINITY_DN1200_c0_g1_i1:139-1005(+)